MPDEKPLPVDPAELRRIREEAGLSQERLSLAMGCSRNDISQWERGVRQIGLERLMRLADACGVSFRYIPGDQHITFHRPGAVCKHVHIPNPA
jgi:transcriptional regulator with XRE-family HTH domain